MRRPAQRGTVLSNFKRLEPHRGVGCLRPRSYLGELRRQKLLLRHWHTERRELGSLIRLLRTLMQDPEFVLTLTAAKFATLPRSLARAMLSDEPDAETKPVSDRHFRCKLSAKAVRPLKDRVVAIRVYGILEKMSPWRQARAIRQMIAHGRYTASYALHLLGRDAKMRPAPNGSLRQVKAFTPHQRGLMQCEADSLKREIVALSGSVVGTSLKLQCAKGFARALLRDERVQGYLRGHQARLLEELTDLASRSDPPEELATVWRSCLDRVHPC